MKKMIVLAGVLFAMTTATYTQAGIPAATAAVAANEDEKTQVDPATLPDAVKATLAGDAYKDWKVGNAWSVKADPVYYSVELIKDDKTTTLNIGADGKVK